MIADVLDDVAQVRLGIQTVEFSCADQAVDRGGTLASGVGTAEKEVLAPESDRTQRPLGGVVVNVGLNLTHLSSGSSE